jgi:hypothetical protein
MTTAAVNAAAVTIKICFFMGGPHVVSELLRIIYTQRTDPTVTYITDVV